MLGVLIFFVAPENCVDAFLSAMFLFRLLITTLTTLNNFNNIILQEQCLDEFTIFFLLLITLNDL